MALLIDGGTCDIGAAGTRAACSSSPSGCCGCPRGSISPRRDDGASRSPRSPAALIKSLALLTCRAAGRCASSHANSHLYSVG